MPATRPSLESESSFNLFRRGKKNQEQEEEKDVDLTTALPSEDDFRTSLLMSGLSARFSMLREQDDPNTKIGKASDDSVLFPKRQSRLAGLGFNGTDLGDIAEVQSIMAPPFLRTDSIASTESGSIMTRSKPTESNVLFGGRQKVYKIAAGASSSRNLGDGMSGRTLYDDDVPMSAFQRWRQTEKDKQREAQGVDDDGDMDPVRTSDGERSLEDSSFMLRPESPLPHGYNKKRETSSTTSSTPSGGRNSTAATSVISQPIAFTKEPTTAISSTASAPTLERHVTRTRRLYEQGLTQDLQEQQHSVLSRVDTLTRKPAGARTPELGANSPSPTMQGFSDRFATHGSERRTVLSKGSAPNLRSMSPPVTGPLNGTMDLNTRVSNQTDLRGNFSPPLSPPISDSGTGDLSHHIQPQDLGKATAMNVFQKPVSPYDDTKYAERQRQLQQGRETPTLKFRDESIFSTSRSQSTAPSIQEESSADMAVAVSPKMTTTNYDEPAAATSVQDNMDSPILNEHIIPSLSPQFRLERPSDNDHPAFRQSNLPAPLTLPSRADEAQSPSPDSGFLTVGNPPAMLADSPTLGPTGGLSGMVRQHLRSGSDVSSIYGPQIEAPISASKIETTPASSTAWEEQDWNDVQSQNDERSLGLKLEVPTSATNDSPATDSGKPLTFLESPRSPDEEDEFANQLANARRRVRQKLTSFVETDASPAPFSPPMAADPAADLPPPPSRSNPLGILRGKGSLGSLIDRGRDAAPRPLKEVGGGEYDREARLQEEENAHPSLRAFRQARRELQKGKEFETTAKRSPQLHGQFSTPPIPETPLAGVNDSNELPRTMSADHLPSGMRQQRPMNKCPRQGLPSPPPRSLSRPSRDRSGSENSDGSGRSRSRPPMRFKECSSPIDEQHRSRDVHPSMRMGPPPGLPGTDVRRSPIKPANDSARTGRSMAPPHLDGINTSFKPAMSGRSVTEPMSAATSPLALRSAPPEGPRSAFQPNGPGSAVPNASSGPFSRRPSVASSGQPNGSGSTLTDSMKRVVNKKDISEPTFLMSTSRVPTKNLPQSTIEEKPDVDYGTPPPLPPVNPRRRNSSRPRTVVNSPSGGNGDIDSIGLSASTPHLPIAPSPTSAFAHSPIEERHPALKDDAFYRKLRKSPSDIRMDARAPAVPFPKRASPPQVAVGPPAGRAVVMAPSKRGTQAHLPGGMF